jgi:demethoxyubiquinone hydroxylase (CLK1/Coq7/Cat5 family)
MPNAEMRLIQILRAAHAGERAAALAYHGHARSLRPGSERDIVIRIGAEETAHRARVREMLADLGAKPKPLREFIFLLIGRTLSALCYVSGWFAPMYGAGWIERRNIQEYVDAQRYAREAGHFAFANELLTMAQVEWDHEQYFRACVASHWLNRIIPLWSHPPAREDLGLIHHRT